MKEIKVLEIPPCDLCKKPNAGIYDAPMHGIMSTWANICEDCAKSKCDFAGIEALGSKRMIQIPAPASEDKEIYEANDTSYPMDVLMDDCQREIECPKCGDTRTVEPDFSANYQCAGCGRTLHAGPMEGC